MNFSFTNISDLIFSKAGNPAWWECPIQQGVPALLNLTKDLLLWAAAFAFIFGVLYAVYNYLTAFGDESKAKKGQVGLTYTLIGAAVVMSAYLAVNFVASFLINPTNDKGSVRVISEDGTINLQNGNSSLQLGQNADCNRFQIGNPTDSGTNAVTGGTTGAGDASPDAAAGQ